MQQSRRNWRKRKRATRRGECQTGDGRNGEVADRVADKGDDAEGGQERGGLERVSRDQLLHILWCIGVGLWKELLLFMGLSLSIVVFVPVHVPHASSGLFAGNQMSFEV